MNIFQMLKAVFTYYMMFKAIAAEWIDARDDLLPKDVLYAKDCKKTGSQNSIKSINFNIAMGCCIGLFYIQSYALLCSSINIFKAPKEMRIPFVLLINNMFFFV